MIRVALVIGRLNIGGAEAELLRLARGLDRARFEPFIVTLQDPGPLGDQVQGVEVVSLGRKHKWRFSTYRALRDLLRERKPDIVQSFLFTENLFCRWIGQGIVVSGLQGSLSDACDTDEGPILKLALERRTFDRARAVVSNSNFYRDLYNRLEFDASKITVIPSGIDAGTPVPRERSDAFRAALGIGPDEIVVTCAARLTERKGHEDLLRAGTGFRLLFAGDGPFRRRLEGRGATLLGPRRDMDVVLAASDIVVLASRFGEGCPNALLEAMAQARPVVATRAGGTEEVVMDGETGMLVSPGDVDALRAALEKLAADPELRSRLGRAGRDRIVDSHDARKMVNSYETLYLKLTEGSQGL